MLEFILLAWIRRIEPPPGSSSAYLPGVSGTGEGEHPTHLRSLWRTCL